MGYMKELDIRIRQGGDDAIAAVSEYVAALDDKVAAASEKWIVADMELRSQGRWIPVDERWPDEGQRVLFFVNRKATNYKAVYAGVFIKCFNVWAYCEEDERGWSPAFVTHWMPLPEPPG